jgi:NitT/TauT family transport system permease protein
MSVSTTEISDVSRTEKRHARTGSILTRLPQVNWEGTVAIILVVVAWQVASSFSSPMFFPSVQKIGVSLLQTLQSADALGAIAITYARIVVSLLASFAVALALGILAARFAPFERFLVPLIELKQGIPAVCWIIFAIIWFRDMEARIAFVIVTSALPSFFYQVRDAFRRIPRDLLDMVRALRPSQFDLLRIIIWPAMLPSILTVWRINIGNATRVTIMAELLGGITGMGHQLRLSQEMFRMDLVIVWSLFLVAFVVLSNIILSAVEGQLLRWRTAEEATHG